MDFKKETKKKKKKKPFNLDELEANLPNENDEAPEEINQDGGGDDAGNLDDDFDFDFSKPKKKKKKKKDLDELVSEKLEEDVNANKENGKIFFKFDSFVLSTFLKIFQIISC